MKLFKLLPAVIILAGSIVFTSGCGKKEAAPPPAPEPVVQEEITPPPPPEPVAPEADTQIALINAVINGDSAFIQAQLDRPIIVDSPLKINTMENALTFRESLRRYPILYDNIRKDTDDLTLLFLAVATQRKAIFDAVIAKDPNVNLRSFKNITPYQVATQNSDSEIIKALLEKGAEPNLLGEDNDIVKAIKRKDYDSAKLLFMYAKNNNIDMTPYLPTISEATAENNLKLLTFLIDAVGLDANKPDMKTGEYPIITAVMNKDEETVKMLLAAGATLDIADNRGRTPLRILVEESKNAPSEGAVNANIRFVGFLISNGADVGYKNSRGETALFDAVKTGNSSLVDAFLSNGADINARDNKGETVLFISTRQDNREMTRDLLSKGVNKTIKNRNGFDAATIAAQEGNMDMFDIINNYKK